MTSPTSKKIITSPAELASMRVNFSIYMRSYLAKKGIDAAFLEENISAEIILKGLVNAPDSLLLQPAKSKPRSLADRRADEVTTDHLQRYFRAEGMPEEFGEKVTGPHVVDHVLFSLPEKLLQQYHDNQAKQRDSSAAGAAKKSERRDSVLNATNSSKKRKRPDPSDDDEVTDSDEFFPTKHMRLSRDKHAKDVFQGQRSISKNHQRKSLKSATEEPALLDLSRSHHQISTPCLTTLTLSPDSTFNTHNSSPKFYAFLATSATFHGARLASVCVTLARAGETDKAKAFGQFGLDLLGPALFDAHVVVCEQGTEEEDGMLFSRIVLVDCVDELHYGWSKTAAAKLRHLVVGEGMWWTQAKGS